MEVSDLLIRLREVTIELSSCHTELATIRVAEARAKSQSWRDSQSSSVSGAEAAARDAAIDFTCDIMSLQGRIAAWREDKDFLMAALEVARSGLLQPEGA